MSKQNIEELRLKIIELETELYQLKIKFKKDIAILQENCKHVNYIAESDYDYHRSRYYYTCTECEHCQSIKPDNGNIIYK